MLKLLTDKLFCQCALKFLKILLPSKITLGDTPLMALSKPTSSRNTLNDFKSTYADIGTSGLLTLWVRIVSPASQSHMMASSYSLALAPSLTKP